MSDLLFEICLQLGQYSFKSKHPELYIRQAVVILHMNGSYSIH